MHVLLLWRCISRSIFLRLAVLHTRSVPIVVIGSLRANSLDPVIDSSVLSREPALSRCLLPNLSLLGDQWLFFLSDVGQRRGSRQASSQVAQRGQIAALGMLAHFSGGVGVGLTTALFEMQAPAACLQEGAEALQRWSCTSRLFLNQLGVERVSGYGFGVGLSQHLCADLQGALGKSYCLAQLPLLLSKKRQIIQCVCGVWMGKGHTLFLDGKSTLVECFRLYVLFHVPVEICQTIEHIGQPGMLGSQCLLINPQSALVECFCFGVLALIPREVGQILEDKSHFGIVRPQRLLKDCQGVLIKCFRLGVLTLISIEQRQIIE